LKISSFLALQTVQTHKDDGYHEKLTLHLIFDIHYIFQMFALLELCSGLINPSTAEQMGSAKANDPQFPPPA
jgi:hypothetical protein